MTQTIKMISKINNLVFNKILNNIIKILVTNILLNKINNTDIKIINNKTKIMIIFLKQNKFQWVVSSRVNKIINKILNKINKLTYKYPQIRI